MPEEEEEEGGGGGGGGGGEGEFLERWFCSCPWFARKVNIFCCRVCPKQLQVKPKDRRRLPNLKGRAMT